MKRKAQYLEKASENEQTENAEQNINEEASGSSNASCLIIGTQNFDGVISQDQRIIDKTLFIKAFMKSSAEVTAILRPRRFGKSLNLSMLKSFLSFGQDPSSFSRYLIGKETKFVEKHCGKYPVVFLDLNDCTGDSWQEMYQSVWECVSNMVDCHENDLKEPISLMKGYGIDYLCPIAPKEHDYIVNSSLSWLMESLYEKHGKRVIVLVDEYDTPLNRALKKGFYKEACKFFTPFYSQALKGNSTLNRACLMGITGAGFAGILGGLNNIIVDTVASKKYSSYFGFTESEIMNVLDDEKTVKEMMEWYDGYKFGRESVINPWSFAKWVRSNEEFSDYWVKTSDSETISTVLEPYIQPAMEQIFTLLFDPEQRVSVSALESNVNHHLSSLKIDSVLHFLVHAGYLNYETDPAGGRGSVWIPNKELRKHWEEDVIGLLKRTMVSHFEAQLREAMLSRQFKVKDLQNAMEKMVQYAYRLPSDHSCRVFIYGCFFMALHNGETIIVSAIKGARDERNAVCVELKEMNRSRNGEDLQNDAKEAVELAKDKEYWADHRYVEVIAIGVSFYGKSMSKLEHQVKK